MCYKTNILLTYLLVYLFDFNLIESLFLVLKQ